MHLLISGIPASGKSNFGRWLEAKKGFLHLDVEVPGVLDNHGLKPVWDALFADGASARPFLEALERFKRPVAVNWGFPPEHLPVVRKLRDGGVMLWWFAADWAVARRKFAERGNRKGAVEIFDRHLQKIHGSLPEINTLFGSHLVYGLPSTGVHTPPEEIWREMLDTLVGHDRRRLGAPPPHPHRRTGTSRLNPVHR